MSRMRLGPLVCYLRLSVDTPCSCSRRHLSLPNWLVGMRSSSRISAKWASFSWMRKQVRASFRGIEAGRELHHGGVRTSGASAVFDGDRLCSPSRMSSFTDVRTRQVVRIGARVLKTLTHSVHDQGSTRVSCISSERDQRERLSLTQPVPQRL